MATNFYQNNLNNIYVFDGTKEYYYIWFEINVIQV